MSDAGVDVLCDTGGQGGATLKKRFAETVLIFLLPPSMAVLSSRLRERQTDSAEEIERRLATARAEIERGGNSYTYVVVNEDLQRAEVDLAAIVRAERLRHQERQKMTQLLLGGGVLG